MPRAVRMYSRRTCGLCDRAREQILAVRADTPFEYDEVFVDDDAALERQYGLRVPVILVDGEEMFEVEVPEEELRSLLAGA